MAQLYITDESFKMIFMKGQKVVIENQITVDN